MILCLDKDGKTSLIVKAASDPQLLEKLFQEYGISFCEILNGEKRLPDWSVSFRRYRQ